MSCNLCVPELLSSLVPFFTRPFLGAAAAAQEVTFEFGGISFLSKTSTKSALADKLLLKNEHIFCSRCELEKVSNVNSEYPSAFLSPSSGVCAN